MFGFNVGGPIIKNKLFFFYNMEWRKLINGTNINQQVPDPDTYGGKSRVPPTLNSGPSARARVATASYLAAKLPRWRTSAQA